MSGYIGLTRPVVTPGAERKKTFAVTSTQTVFTGLSYTPEFVHVYHNGVRLVDGTDYTATNGNSITLTSAAENGDEVVVISFATFQAANAYTKSESDDRYRDSVAADILPDSDDTRDLGSSSKAWAEAHVGDLYASGNLSGVAVENLKKSFKNYIWNGVAPYVQQEGAKTSLASGDYAADQWRLVHSGAGVYNTNIVSDLIEVDVTTADASLAAGDYAALQFLIEGIDAVPLKIGTSDAEQVTLTFEHKHTKTGTFCVSFQNSANNRSYVAEYTQSVANTLEESTVTLTLDTSGTWLTSKDTLGLSVYFTAASGTTYQGTADSWQASNIIATSNQVNGVDSAANYFRIGNVRLVVGSDASVAVNPDWDTKYQKAERYLRYRAMLMTTNGWPPNTNTMTIQPPMSGAPTVTVLSRSSGSGSTYLTLGVNVPGGGTNYTVYQAAANTAAGLATLEITSRIV